jgi:hypothetical protein
MGEADTVYDATFTRRSGKKVVHTDTRGWSIPYCSRCLDHINHLRTAVIALVLGIVAAVGMECIGIWGGYPRVFLLFAVPFLGLGFWGYYALHTSAKSLATEDCICLGPAVEYHGWSGSVHNLAFRNADYAAAFARNNRTRLIW